MQEELPRMISAREVAKRLGVSSNTAYSIIKELNKEMESRGCKTLPGKVSSSIFEETYFNPGKEVE